nr:LysM peptidoglycan-binding domain-containing protein [Pleionea sp. CnH1-48]
MLERGQQQNARQALLKLIKQSPNNATAKRLLAQLNQSPQQRYGKSHIKYKVKAGDSFGKLAQKYLGHYLEFYGLARYNNIRDPRKLSVGQIIKIPQKQPKPTKESLSANSSITRAQQQLNDQQPLAAIKTLIQASSLKGYQRQANKLLWSSVTLYIRNSQTVEALQTGQKKVTEFFKQSSHHPFLASNFKQAQDYFVFHYQLFQSQQAHDAGNDNEAYSHFAKAAKYSFDLPASSQQLQHTLCENMHRQAVLEYRSQNLEQAIALWDKILIINPQHEPARLYRAKANKLKSRLKQLDTTSQ